jgi:hypothetical protein
MTRGVASRALGPVVYAVRIDGLIKIGFSADIVRRLDWYRCHIGEPELLAFAAGDLKAEAALHKRFKTYRARGKEWYHPTTELLGWVNETRRVLGLPLI